MATAAETPIWQLQQWSMDAGRMVVLEERHANESQLETVERLGGTIVTHRFTNRNGDESVQRWALVQVPKRVPCFIDEKGDLHGAGNGPYPWCSGNPTVAHCMVAGYCQRNPSCGS
jgi:hypothetical protein